jgi:hypothetical protein
MERLRLAAFFLLALIVPLQIHAVKLRGLTPVERIESLYQQGEIGKLQYLTYKRDLLIDPYSLPPSILGEKFRPQKCGTGIVLEILRCTSDIPEELRPDFLEPLVRPDKQKYFDTPGGCFRIHYDTSGAHVVYQPEVDDDPADGHPDYVNRCGEYFDRAWAFQVDTLGYDAPPHDGNNGGGENLYDVYLHHYSGAYGVSFPDSHSTQYGSRPGCYTSYIYCDPTYEGFGYPDPLLPLQVTSAHEFFHAVQFAYNVSTDVWWMENSSTWMEDVMWDDVNDNYLYLPWFFQFPHQSLLTENGAHEYGGFVWAQFLYQRFGHDLVRTTWEYAVNLQAYYAIGSALLNFASFFEAEFEEFTLWNYITGDRDDGLHYEEGANYPEITIMRAHSSYPVWGQTSGPNPEGLASSYVVFHSPGEEKHLLVHFDGSNEASWGANLIGAKIGNQYDFTQIPLNADNYGYAFIQDFQNYESAILIPAVLTPDTYGHSFEYSAELDSMIYAVGEGFSRNLPGDLALMQNFPNPFNLRTVISYQLPTLCRVQLEIYNLLGEKVATLLDGQQKPGYRTIAWEARDFPSGVYFYKLTVGDFNRKRAMLLVK